MDQEELERLINEINITSIDDRKLLLNAEEMNSGTAGMVNCLVARVISAKAVNREAFRS